MGVRTPLARHKGLAFQSISRFWGCSPPPCVAPRQESVVFCIGRDLEFWDWGGVGEKRECESERAEDTFFRAAATGKNPKEVEESKLPNPLSLYSPTNLPSSFCSFFPLPVRHPTFQPLSL